MASKTDDLAAQLSAILAASPLPYDDKVAALILARKTLQTPSASIDQWRAKRAADGPVGSGKKTDAMREAAKSKPRGNK